MFAETPRDLNFTGNPKDETSVKNTSTVGQARENNAAVSAQCFTAGWHFQTTNLERFGRKSLNYVHTNSTAR